ncbi:MAG: ATP-binding protein [Candidatus Firestonebacteria bacterium]
MIKRQLTEKILKLTSKYPVLTITGPRQSGKTTLVKSVFKSYKYVSLEDPDVREAAMEDPRRFLQGASESGLIVDEAQRAPDLFSYIQTYVDNSAAEGRIVLTGSQNFLLMARISQSLAGRTAIFKLMPFSLAELSDAGYKMDNSGEYILKGFYPRIYDKKLEPIEWYPGYINTYLERDVRQLKNISDISSFHRFIRMCAGRTGQLLNLSSLGSECGITHSTAKAWISMLEASSIVYLLRPYHTNFNKRLTSIPKLYFYDTGLACSLLGIKNIKELISSHFYGQLFETFIISEVLKNRLNKAEDPDLYFIRENHGKEIDCLIQEGSDHVIGVEIKAGFTVNEDYFSGIKYWKEQSNNLISSAYVIYNGDEAQKRKYAEVIPWNRVAGI